MSEKGVPRTCKFWTRELEKLAKFVLKVASKVCKPVYFLSLWRCQDFCACVPEAEPG